MLYIIYFVEKYILEYSTSVENNDKPINPPILLGLAGASPTLVCSIKIFFCIYVSVVCSSVPYIPML